MSGRPETHGAERARSVPRRHQFPDADANTRVGTGTDDLIKSSAERRAAARTEPRTREGRRGAWGRLD